MMQMADLDSPAGLLQSWQDAWPQALEVWSKYTRLSHPQLCASSVEAAKEGLLGSFAMIRLLDQRVVVDLAAVERLGLQGHAVEILAHEIGHHVLVPGTVTEQLRLLARIRKALPTLGHQAPMVANLYADLIINDRLQRQAGLRLADVYRALAGSESAGTPRSEAWNLYLRIYENLWRLAPGSLGGQRGDTRSEGDAWLGARLVRVYANDWLAGAGRFATLLLHYLVEDTRNLAENPIRHLLDMTGAAAGCEPFGGTLEEPDEAGGAIHPAQDPWITGQDEGPTLDAPQPADRAPRSGGHARDPSEYGDILRGAGFQLTDHEIAVRYYRESALPHLVPFPQRAVPDRAEPLLEGLEPWDTGDPLDEIDWLQTVMQSPRVIPGLTTVRRQYGHEQGRALERRPVDLDLYVDSSGSMPNPQREMSYLSLAGAVIALSALRAGSRVQVTLWSGKDQCSHTRGFIRDEAMILQVLTGFFGGWTAFPIHRLRETHGGPTKHDRPAHILMISDDGITTMFDSDKHGNDGWAVSAQALAAAGGGGTMALNINPHWDTTQATGALALAYAALQRARSEQGWDIHAISRLEDLVGFARAFSRRHYA